MSTMSIRDPASPIMERDIRSRAVAYKRDKDQREKWSNGAAPGYGLRANLKFIPGGDEPEFLGGNEQHLARVRPRKTVSQISHTEKSHANKTPKPYGNYDTSRTLHKASATMESNDSTLSRSLLDLLPTYANHSDTSIITVLAHSAPDSEILYSFDNKGPSPGSRGTAIGLDSLVERAERKWVAEQTDKIVKGEYEVLDAQGEIVTTSSKKSTKKSPKTKPQSAKKAELEEDDGFQLI